MPRIRIRDCSGQVEEVSSTNPVTVALWLYEHAKRNVSENFSFPSVMLEVWPLYDYTGKADWKPGHEVHDMDVEQMHELMNRLHNILWPKELRHDPTEDEYALLRAMRNYQNEMTR